MKMAIKNLVLAVSILSVGATVAWARQTPTPSAAPEATANAPCPRIQFATPVYDFGRVRSGDLVRYTYVFTNTGDALLIINGVQPQCGCTTAGDWTKQVESGKTGVIPIQFNSSGYNSSVFKQVTVTCNITNKPPTVVLQLKGTIYKPYDVVPPIAVLNIAPDAESASMVINITNNTDEPLILSAPEINNRMFSARFVTNQPGKGYQLTVSAVPHLPIGSVQGQINMKTSWTNPPVITVTAVATAQPAVMVIPAYLTLPSGALLNALTNSVTIQNKSTNALKLSDPIVSVPAVGAQIRETQPGNMFTALLSFPQGFQVPTGQQVELSIKTSNPKFPVIKVPIMQMPRPPAAVAPPPPAPAVAPVAPVRQVTPVAPVRKVSSAAAKSPPEMPPLPPGF
jgi:hypothetical protein